MGVEERAGVDDQREITVNQFSCPPCFSSFFQPLSLSLWNVLSPRELLPRGESLKEALSLSPSSSTTTSRLSFPSPPSLSLLHVLFNETGVDEVFFFHTLGEIYS